MKKPDKVELGAIATYVLWLVLFFSIRNPSSNTLIFFTVIYYAYALVIWGLVYIVRDALPFLSEKFSLIREHISRNAVAFLSAKLFLIRN